MVEFLNPATFKCTKCGECCRPLVLVDETDIKRIEELGLKRKNFLDYDPMNENASERNILKQKNNVCMFLGRKGEEYYCKIYENRPQVCRVYPFYEQDLQLEDCKPKWFKKPPPLEKLVPDSS
jgi:uncharacterized protein